MGGVEMMEGETLFNHYKSLSSKWHFAVFYQLTTKDWVCTVVGTNVTVFIPL